MRQELRLNCNDCGGFHTYHRADGDPKTVVRCDGCGKRHSRHSIHMVKPGHAYERDERGNLLESPI